MDRRRQEQQQQEQQQQPAVVRPENKKTLGQFVWDPHRQAYFPKGTTVGSSDPVGLEEEHEIEQEEEEQQQPQHRHHEHPHATRIVLLDRASHKNKTAATMKMTTTTTTNLLHGYRPAAELCLVSSVRRRIGAHWRGRVFLASIDAGGGAAKSSAADPQQQLHQRPIRDIDVYSAPNRHAFAAFATRSHESVVWYSAATGATMHRVRRLTTTTDNEEEGQQQQHQQHQQHLAMNQPSSIKQDATRGDVVVLSDRQQSLTCYKYCCPDDEPVQPQLRLVTTLDTKSKCRSYCINDFAVHSGCDTDDARFTTVLAHDQGRWSLNQLDRIDIVSSHNRHNTTTTAAHSSSSSASDILSIEFWPARHRAVVVCGHRNGQVSLADWRTGATAEWRTPPDPYHFGNIAALRPLPDDDGDGRSRFSFLAQSYSGVCRLYDVRKNDGPLFTMASSASSSSSSVAGRRPVGCKGMTTDQCHSLLINAVPAAGVGVGGGDGGCALEVWSLCTGEFIHSRRVTTTSSTSDRPCELGSTMTPNRHGGTSLWIAQHQGQLLQVNLKERYLHPFD
jgi:chitodextrinase